MKVQPLCTLKLQTLKNFLCHFAAMAVFRA